MPIHLCPNCKPHPFQDEVYGKKMRVHNIVKSEGNSVKGRCTVCEAINTIKDRQEKEIKK